MKRERWVLGILGLLFSFPISLGYGEEGAARFGAGVSLDRSIPILGLSNRYPASQQYGVVFENRLSSKTVMELEYHWTRLDDGKIDGLSFVWPVDKQRYASPQAHSRMTFHGYVINALIRLGPEPSTAGMRLRPYIAIGAGFYDYNNTTSGLIYPGQKVKPLNPDLLMDPQTDAHTSIGANAGLGMCVIQGHFGLDLRARCHMVLGDLRPMEAWGTKSVFPMAMIDMRTAFKFYFR